MNDTVKEWLQKADRDYATAKREFAALEQPNYDAGCFHAQQCIEKIIKGLLIHSKQVPPKTHDLAYLVQLLSPVSPGWTWPLEDFRFLSRAAIAFRYPGESADREDAALSIDIATRLREKLLSLFQ